MDSLPQPSSHISVGGCANSISTTEQEIERPKRRRDGSDLSTANQFSPRRTDSKSGTFTKKTLGESLHIFPDTIGTFNFRTAKDMARLADHHSRKSSAIVPPDSLSLADGGLDGKRRSSAPQLLPLGISAKDFATLMREDEIDEQIPPAQTDGKISFSIPKLRLQDIQPPRADKTPSSSGNHFPHLYLRDIPPADPSVEKHILGLPYPVLQDSTRTLPYDEMRRDTSCLQKPFGRQEKFRTPTPEGSQKLHESRNLSTDPRNYLNENDDDESGGWFWKLMPQSDRTLPSRPDGTNLTSRPSPRRTTVSEGSGLKNIADDPRNDYDAKAQDRRHGSQTESQQRMPSFGRAIQDLEDLLNEALNIAKVAAERHETRPLPTLLEEAARALRSNYGEPARRVTAPIPVLDKDQVGTRRSVTMPSSPRRSKQATNFSHTDDSSAYSNDSLTGTQSEDDLYHPHVIITEPEVIPERPHNGKLSDRESTPWPSASNSRNASRVLEGSLQAPEPSNLAKQTFNFLQVLTRPLKANAPPPVPEKDDVRQDELRRRNATHRKPPAENVMMQPLDQELHPIGKGLANFHSSRPTPQHFYNQSNFSDVERGHVVMDDSDFHNYTGYETEPEPVLEQYNGLPPEKNSAALGVSFVPQQKRNANTKASHSVYNHIRQHKGPPILPRISSLSQLPPDKQIVIYAPPVRVYDSDQYANTKTRSPGIDSVVDSQSAAQARSTGIDDVIQSRPHSRVPTREEKVAPIDHGGLRKLEIPPRKNHVDPNGYTLRDRHHFSLRDKGAFSLTRSHRRQPIARDWGTFRKRFTASVACLGTALVGIIVGIYAGEVPSIQYAIVDFHHYAILGNVFFYLGLAIPTLFCWTLPLLHGRKPYVLLALALLMPLQLPQGVAVMTPRNPDVASYRVALLLARAASGFFMGFANVNFKATLLDLFGSSLQSGNPHQEIVNEYDVRRHGGGMGVWLSIWSWCYIGSIGVGFILGASIINDMNPSWGFWLVVILAAFVLLCNVLAPEVRRSAFRRSIAEVRHGKTISRRVARGEVMMHLYQTGPRYFWEEVKAGVVLSWRMIKQPGFAILSVYAAWIYGQIIMVVILLGALASRYYRHRPAVVGACVSSVPIGALIAIPFQKASLFSRSRHHPPRTDSGTFEKRITWTSHLLRRAVFVVMLPIADLAYTLASAGPPTHISVPIIFAAFIGFFSTLAIAECNGLIMETYDTSDLQPGMTGQRRHRNRLGGKDPEKKYRTNFSCFPRVNAAFAIVQTFGFILAAAATGTGGRVERRLGAQAATGIVAFILSVLSLLLILVLWRFKEVQVVPTHRFGASFQPVVIGNPSGKVRRMSLLELGGLSRWTEIRRRNKLAAAEGVGVEEGVGSVIKSLREGAMERSKGSLRKVGLSRNGNEKPVVGGGGGGGGGGDVTDSGKSEGGGIGKRRMPEW